MAKYKILIIFLTYLILTLITTHPLWQNLTIAVPNDIGDPLLNTWILAWDGHAILNEPLNLFNANIFYPLRNTLAYSEHLLSTALLIFPIQHATREPVLAYNLSLLISFPMSGFGMYLLVLYWTRKRGAAFIAGLAFAFAPYRLASIAHLQLLTVQWLPYSLLTFELLLNKKNTNQKLNIIAFQFVVFTTLQILSSWYLAVFTTMILSIYGIIWLAKECKNFSFCMSQLRHVFASTLIILVLTISFAMPYIKVLPELKNTRPLSVALSLTAQPSDFLHAAPYLHVDNWLPKSPQNRLNLTEEHALFLGFITPLLACLGLRFQWRPIALLMIFLLSISLMFAPFYKMLTALIPYLTIIRVPARWVIPAIFALSGLIGYGVARLKQNHILLFFIGALVFIESVSANIPLAYVGSTIDLPTVYQTLQMQSDRQAVVELPMHVYPNIEYPETKRLYASTLGWWGLVNGYSGFTPKRQLQLVQILGDFNVGHVPSKHALQTLQNFSRMGVRYLIVHTAEPSFDKTQWDDVTRWEIERQTTLIPIGRFEHDDLYFVNPYGDELIRNPAVAINVTWANYVPQAMNVRFTSSAEQIEFRHAEIELLAYLYHADQNRLTLYWQTSKRLTKNYTVFIHALNENGMLIGQADAPPIQNHYPTEMWQIGEIIQDSRIVPMGKQYLIGWYDPNTGKRLASYRHDGERLPNDAIILYEK
ncbi:MAG: hypothetical protein B6242_11970 [Anaerolineaceae bacterium 4572_78]|nr:MAG: hypothetical protein B6242_11970 [Anaerolineaceae bacterium 4572_78]